MQSSAPCFKRKKIHLLWVRAFKTDFAKPWMHTAMTYDVLPPSILPGSRSTRAGDQVKATGLHYCVRFIPGITIPVWRTEMGRGAFLTRQRDHGVITGESNWTLQAKGLWSAASHAQFMDMPMVEVGRGN